MIISTFLLILAIVLFLYSFYKFAYYRPLNFPPGPPRLPIWGSYWILLAIDYKFPARALHWLSKKVYRSPVIGMYMGEYPTVVVNGAKSIKELFLNQDFNGRMDTIFGRLRADGEKHGIFFTDGPFWHEQRRFSLRYMRDWGFGRRCPRLEQLMSDEISTLLELIQNPPKDHDIVKNDLVYLPDVFHVPFINFYLGVIRGHGMDSSKSAFLTSVGQKAIEFLRAGDDMGGALSFTPWIRHFAPFASSYEPLKQTNQYLVNFIKSIIKECKENLTDEYDNNFFDKYLKLLKEQDLSKETTFSETQLALVGVDFLFPTAGATAVILSLLIREIIYKSKIQDQIHAELDYVVGRGRLPNLDDRNKLIYLEACLRESMRKIPPVPLGVPHRATHDTVFEGYTIPKDTMMVTNIWSYHMDRDVWGDPENFRPERFIDENNRLIKDTTLPFGAGKRLCAGETFARQTMFLVIAAVLQNFHVSPASPKPRLLPGVNINHENYWVRFTLRK